MNNDSEWFNSIINEYSSLEFYLCDFIRGGGEPLLYGVRPFEYLIENNFLIEGDVIRTNLEGGSIDGHYEVAPGLKLKGIDAADGFYKGRIGFHDYREILNLENVDNGWTLGGFAKGRICRRSIENEI